MGKKKAAPPAAGGMQLISRFFSASATKKAEDAGQLPSRKRRHREGVDKAPVLDTAGKLGDAYTKQQQHYAKRRKAAVNEGGAFSGDDGDGGGIDDAVTVPRGDELKDTLLSSASSSTKAVASSRELCSEESRSRIESLSEDDLARSLRFATRLQEIENRQEAAARAAAAETSSDSLPSVGRGGKGSGRDGKCRGKSYTPGEVQVLELKAAHPGMLLMIEVGYKFKFFGDDASAAAAALGIVAHLPTHGSLMTAAVPVYNLAKHVKRLVEAGHKVGVVKQTDTAATKAAGLTKSGKTGTFARALAAVYTSSTLLDDDILGASRPSTAASWSSAASSKGGGGGRAGKAEGKVVRPFFHFRGNQSKNRGGSGGGNDVNDDGGGGGYGDDNDEEQEQCTTLDVDDDRGGGGGSELVKDSDLDGDNEGIEKASAEANSSLRGENGVQLREQWLLCIYEEDDDRSQQHEEDDWTSATQSAAVNQEVTPPSAANQVLSISLIAADLQSGRVLHSTFSDEYRAGRRGVLERALRNLNPSELLLASGPSGAWHVSAVTQSVIRRFVGGAVDAVTGRPRIVRIETLSRECFHITNAKRSIFTFLQKNGFESGIEDLELGLHRTCTCCLGALVKYLEPLKLDRVLLRAGNVQQAHLSTDEVVKGAGARGTTIAESVLALERLESASLAATSTPAAASNATLAPQSCDSNEPTENVMRLTGQTLRDLEIFQVHPSGKEKGSLFWHLNRTVTAGGGRLLRQWLRAPIFPTGKDELSTDARVENRSRFHRKIRNQLEDRLDAVSLLAGHNTAAAESSAASPLPARFGSTKSSSSASSSASVSAENASIASRHDGGGGSGGGTRPNCLAKLTTVIGGSAAGGNRRQSRVSEREPTGCSSSWSSGVSLRGFDLDAAVALLHYRRCGPRHLLRLLGSAHTLVTALPTARQLQEQILPFAPMLYDSFASIRRDVILSTSMVLMTEVLDGAVVESGVRRHGQPVPTLEKAAALQYGFAFKASRGTGTRNSDDDEEGSGDDDDLINMDTRQKQARPAQQIERATREEIQNSDEGRELKDLLVPLRRAREVEIAIETELNGTELTDAALVLNESQPALPTATSATFLACSSSSSTSSSSSRTRAHLEYKHVRSGFTSLLEYLIEVPIKRREQVPSNWTIVNSTKQYLRCQSPGIVAAYQRLLQAREATAAAGSEAWSKLVEFVDNRLHEPLVELATAINTFDALDALAKVATLPGYVRPLFNLSLGAQQPRRMVVTGARHPIVERLLEVSSSANAVPNDVHLSTAGGERGGTIVTGPNMGGKSTYVRMIAVLAIMGQMGSYVPADEAMLAPFDAIYTRMGAEDDLARGMSTFLTELHHTSLILRSTTPQSLVILDELGRGTATHDGVAIARATLRYLASEPSRRCALLFVTHYPEIAKLATQQQEQPRHGALTSLQETGPIVNIHMAFMVSSPSGSTSTPSCDLHCDSRDSTALIPETRAWGIEKDDVTFLYQAVDGYSGTSHGLNVARMAGLPVQVLQSAARKAQSCAKLLSLQRKYLSAEMEAQNDTDERTPDVLESSVSSIRRPSATELIRQCNAVDLADDPIDLYNSLVEAQTRRKP